MLIKANSVVNDVKLAKELFPANPAFRETPDDPLHFVLQLFVHVLNTCSCFFDLFSCPCATETFVKFSRKNCVSKHPRSESRAVLLSAVGTNTTALRPFVTI